MKKGVLYPYDSLDVLNYYSAVSKTLENFLKGKPIASKTWLVGNVLYFLRRASKNPRLNIKDFKFVNDKLLKLRAHGKLSEVKNQLNEKQILLWEYFVPRKFSSLFYSTNDEGVGKSINRIFLDIDRKKHSADESRVVCLNLVENILNDKLFNSLVRYRLVILWTGKSFHIYILLNKSVPFDFYARYLSYGKNDKDSFILKWVEEISKSTGLKVGAGHEKSSKKIIIDSSNTPSGKLARAPFSLHIKNAKEFDGVSVPVSIEELKDKNIIQKLEKLTPDEVLKNLNYYKKLL